MLLWTYLLMSCSSSMSMDTRSGLSSWVKGCESADTPLDDALDLLRFWSSNLILTIIFVSTSLSSRSNALTTSFTTMSGREGGNDHGVTILCDPRIRKGVVISVALRTRRRTEHAGQQRLETPIMDTACIAGHYKKSNGSE